MDTSYGAIVTGKFRDGTPAAVAILGDVVEEFLILLRGPEALLQLLIVAARVPSHWSSLTQMLLSDTENERSRRSCRLERREQINRGRDFLHHSRSVNFLSFLSSL